MAKKKKGSNTLEMFKAWLSGVEEMQGPDWTPSPEQWKKIRDKIENIEEEVPQAVPAGTAAQSVTPIPQFPISLPQMMALQQPAYASSGLQPTTIDINNPPPVGEEFV